MTSSVQAQVAKESSFLMIVSTFHLLAWILPDADLVAPSACSKRMNGLDARAATAIVRINDKVAGTSMAGHYYTLLSHFYNTQRGKRHI